MAKKKGRNTKSRKANTRGARAKKGRAKRTQNMQPKRNRSANIPETKNKQSGKAVVSEANLREQEEKNGGTVEKKVNLIIKRIVGWIKVIRRKMKLKQAGFIAFIIALAAFLADVLGIIDFFRPGKAQVVDTSVRILVSREQPGVLEYSNALYNQGVEFFKQGDYKNAIDCYEEAMKQHKEIKNADWDVARIQYAAGLAYRYSDDVDTAIKLYTKAIGTLESVAKKMSKDMDTEKLDQIEYEMGYVHYLRGIVYGEMKDLERALIDCQVCLDNFEGDSNGNMLGDYYSLASVKNLEGGIYFSYDYLAHSEFAIDEYKGVDMYTMEDALNAFNEAIVYKGAVFCINDESITPDDDVIVVKSYLPVEKFILSGNLKLQFPFKDSVYIITQKDAEMAVILTNRASALCRLGEYDSAIENCEAALEIYENVPINERYDIYDTYWKLADIKLKKAAKESDILNSDVVKEYKALMKKGFDYNAKWFPGSSREALAYENMGSACMLSYEFSKAIAYYEEAERIYMDLNMQREIDIVRDMIESIKMVKDQDVVLEPAWESLD